MTEEARKAVESLRICHSNEDCRDCKFIDSDKDEMSCVNVLFTKTADLIESLSATCDQLTDALKTRGFENIEAVFAEMDQVKMERDAAVKHLGEVALCQDCAHYTHNGGNCSGELFCKSHETGFNWQWRGVEVE